MDLQQLKKIKPNSKEVFDIYLDLLPNITIFKKEVLYLMKNGKYTLFEFDADNFVSMNDDKDMATSSLDIFNDLAMNVITDWFIIKLAEFLNEDVSTIKKVIYDQLQLDGSLITYDIVGSKYYQYNENEILKFIGTIYLKINKFDVNDLKKLITSIINYSD